MKLNVLLVIVFFLILTFSVTGQINNQMFLKNNTINPANRNKLFFGVENVNYLKNNEYFNKYYEGFTLLGYFLKPRFIYYPDSKVKIDAGVFLQKYSGINGFSEATPLFTFQYAPSQYFDMVIGTIYGSYNHRLIEPLYQSDLYYREQQENGLQLLFDFKRFRSDIWVSWEKFIFPGDPFQEKIFGGYSGNMFVLPEKPGKKLKIEIPIQATVLHRGGQIDASNQRMSTLVNYAAGVKAGLLLKKQVSLFMDAYFTGFNDLSPTKQFPYISGYGLLGDIGLKIRKFSFMAGYWQGENYISPKGEPLFQSFSQIDSNYFRDNRYLVTFKADYTHKITRGIFLNCRFESYFDTDEKKLDYSYSLNILFDRSFFIRSIANR